MSQTSWKDTLITMANYKYPAELRERATRLAVEARRDPATRIGAIARIAKQTNVHKEALRNWVSKAEAEDVPTEPVDAQTRIPDSCHRVGASSLMWG